MVTCKIVYYCHKRKKKFSRMVLLDPGQEHKIEGKIFRTWRQIDRPDFINVCISTSTGFTCKSVGISTSVPALLFGPTFYNARRNDLQNIWDWRRCAFTPVSTTIIDTIISATK